MARIARMGILALLAAFVGGCVSSHALITEIGTWVLDEPVTIPAGKTDELASIAMLRQGQWLQVVSVSSDNANVNVTLAAKVIIEVDGKSKVQYQTIEPGKRWENDTGDFIVGVYVLGENATATGQTVQGGSYVIKIPRT